MKRTQKMVLGIVTIATLGILAASYARGMGMGPDGRCAIAGMEDKEMGSPGQIDSNLEKMKKNLGISAEQETAWEAFANKIKQQKMAMMSAMQQQHAGTARSTQSAPDRIGAQAQLMKQRVADMEAVAAAMTQLYTVLTPQQKEILDTRIGREMPMY